MFRHQWLLCFSVVLLLCNCTSPSPNQSRVPSGRPSVQPAVETLDPETIAKIGKIFEQVMIARHGTTKPGVKRAVFLKPHGCAKGKMEILTLPENLRVGLFAKPEIKDVWVRISSDTVPQTSDRENNTIGFAIKVLGVPGRKILPNEEEFETQDFLTQNHNVFFVDTAKDFLEFSEASVNGKFDEYVAAHPTTDKILKDMAKPLDNILNSTFWSTLPSRFGANDFVKYKVIPCEKKAEQTLPDKPDYLRERLSNDLLKGGCYFLQVQLQSGNDMPLDQATHEWSEIESPPQTVAKIVLPPQKIAGNTQVCEDLSFTAWHSLPEHQPVGTISQAREVVYKRLADLRRQRNRIPLTEPGTTLLKSKPAQ